MHVLHRLLVFPYAAHDAVEIALLPDPAFGVLRSVEAERRRNLDGVQDVRQRVIFARDDEGVPV